MKRKISIYLSKISIATKILVALSLAILLISGEYKKLNHAVRIKVSETFGELGYVLENVVIIGQKNISNSEIVGALSADVGTPIFAINLDDSRNIINKNGWVKSADLIRKLPDTIIFRIVERQPIALWQSNKKLYVVDSEGDIIEGIQAENFPNLLHIVGEGANIYAADLIAELSKNSELAGKVVHAIRYGNRRWDLHFQGGLIVKMPQSGFSGAYSYLTDLYNKNKLFHPNIRSVDLRDEKKAYVEKMKEATQKP